MGICTYSREIRRHKTEFHEIGIDKGRRSIYKLGFQHTPKKRFIMLIATEHFSYFPCMKVLFRDNQKGI
jgi:hypothetical protein